jgi:hypothetical protein
VFQAVHENDPDPKLLAYQYLQTLPQLANGAGNTFWVIPSEMTTALKAVTSAFGGAAGEAGTRSASDAPKVADAAPEVPAVPRQAAIPAQAPAPDEAGRPPSNRRR